MSPIPHSHPHKRYQQSLGKKLKRAYSDLYKFVFTHIANVILEI